ncbi:MAG: hypothetical protein PHX18_00405 [Candidatus Gastranaerophilales bacterium]|nr:hypothetical protein [Candidatus Gastranaerophilales bacterium]
MSTIPNLQQYPPQLQPHYPNPYGQQAAPQQYYTNPYALPQVNAVKIDINNPQAYGGQGQAQAQQLSPYNIPYAPVYHPAAGQPIPAPAAYAPPIVPVQPAPVSAVPTAPVAPAIPVPVVPAPTLVAETPAPSSVAAAEPIAPVTPVAAAEPIAPVAPVAPVQEAIPSTNLDVNGLIAALASSDQDAQTAAIQKIAEVAQADPIGSKSLLNEQVFEGLSKIINADTSKLQGPAGDAQNQALSPLEKAEINKQFGVYTLAILQKNFREEINKEMAKNNLPSISVNDLPYIKEGIVDNLKDNPNPTVREACLSALNYLGKPEDKEVLRILYDISAKHDANNAVKATASEYLSKLPA